MRRRGLGRKGSSLEEGLSQTGRILLAVLCIIVVIGVSYKIIDIFVNGEKHARAERNFDLLVERIELAAEKDLQPPESSVIIHLPEDYLIAGFDAGQGSIEFPQAEGFAKVKEYFSTYMTKQQVDSIVIPRPSKCDAGRACICLFATSPDRQVHFWKATSVELNYDPISCKELEQRSIAGTASSVQVELTGANGIIPLAHKGSLYDLVMTSHIGEDSGPKNVVIRHSTMQVTLATDAVTGLNPDGGGFGGAGSTGGWEIKK